MLTGSVSTSPSGAMRSPPYRGMMTSGGSVPRPVLRFEYPVEYLPEFPMKYPIAAGPRLIVPAHPKVKRKRRTFAELSRDYVCGLAGCTRRYASAHALQQHKRIKHSTRERASKQQPNGSTIQSTPENFSQAEDGEENSQIIIMEDGDSTATSDNEVEDSRSCCENFEEKSVPTAKDSVASKQNNTAECNGEDCSFEPDTKKSPAEQSEKSSKNRKFNQGIEKDVQSATENKTNGSNLDEQNEQAISSTLVRSKAKLRPKPFSSEPGTDPYRKAMPVYQVRHEYVGARYGWCSTAGMPCNVKGQGASPSNASWPGDRSCYGMYTPSSGPLNREWSSWRGCPAGPPNQRGYPGYQTAANGPYEHGQCASYVEPYPYEPTTGNGHCHCAYCMQNASSRNFFMGSEGNPRGPDDIKHGMHDTDSRVPYMPVQHSPAYHGYAYGHCGHGGQAGPPAQNYYGNSGECPAQMVSFSSRSDYPPPSRNWPTPADVSERAYGPPMHSGPKSFSWTYVQEEASTSAG